MRPHQHGQSTHTHDGIAQAHGQRTAHHGLNQGGVGHQPADDFASGRGFKKRGALLENVAVNRIAQIGGDAFTQPADCEKARRRK